MDCFIKAQNFEQAIKIAKERQPEIVAKLFIRWGEFLMARGSFEEASG